MLHQLDKISTTKNQTKALTVGIIKATRNHFIL
jgi:hypothetical protein